MTPKQHCNVYIASCETDGGIYHYRYTPTGSLTFLDFTPLDRPMYMTVCDSKLFVLLRSAFEDNLSGLISFDIEKDGSLTNPSPIISTKGEVACHLTVKENNVYCVNYISGSVSKPPDKTVTHYGKGINPQRQSSPHTHFVGFTPDNKYLCVTDLGLDSIFMYDKDLNLINQYKVPVGHGARHLVFSDDGNYCFVANELKSTVSAFEYSDGHLKLISTQSCLPKNFKGISTASAIRYHNGLIYVSNRGHDSISQLSFDGSKIKLLQTIDCHGKTPRDFIFIGNHIFCANQDSNNVSVLTHSDNVFVLKEQIIIKTPICITYSY